MTSTILTKNYSSNIATTLTILTAKLFFKHGINKNDDINKLDNKTIKFKHGINMEQKNDINNSDSKTVVQTWQQS